MQPTHDMLAALGESRLLRRILITAIAIGLSACATRHIKVAHEAPPPVITAPTAPPVLAQGLWAVLDPGCPKPVAADINQWPACASPFWISHGRALIIHTAAWGASGHIDASFAADYSLAGGDPVIAQVGTQKDGYLYLALTRLSTDSQGQLVDAMGAAISCPKPAQGALIIKPSLNGCDSETPEAVRRAGVLALQDRASLDEVAFIAPGNP